MQTLQLSSFLESASESLSRAFGSGNSSWKLISDLVRTNGQLVLFALGENKVEVIDLKTMNAYLLTLPFDVDSVLPSSPGKWLIQDTSGGIYALEKTSESLPCPNALKALDADFDIRPKIGRFLAASGKQIADDTLSAALEQKIESPNRVLVSDSTYATLVVGFPDLDGPNDVFYWPREKRLAGFSPPLVSNDGQIVRTVSPSHLPLDLLPGGKKPQGIASYLEIVDVGERKLRYLPIPE